MIHNGKSLKYLREGFQKKKLVKARKMRKAPATLGLNKLGPGKLGTFYSSEFLVVTITNLVF